MTFLRVALDCVIVLSSICVPPSDLLSRPFAFQRSLFYLTIQFPVSMVPFWVDAFQMIKLLFILNEGRRGKRRVEKQNLQFAEIKPSWLPEQWWCIMRTKQSLCHTRRFVGGPCRCMLHPSNRVLKIPGLSPEGLLHRQPRTPPAHDRGLLADDLGVEVLLHRHVDGAGRTGSGELPRSE